MGELSPSDAIALAGGGRNNNDGFGDGNGWWIILLFMIFGWGGNRNGWNGQGGGYAGGDMLYPWLNQSQQVNNGFRDQMMNTTLVGIQNGITAGFANAATQLCQCCGEMQMAIAGLDQAANARQMAGMQQAFAAQTAMMQGFNGLQSQLSDCCCENRLATANQTATILAEHCSDRAALSDGVRDIIAAQQAGTQRIIDQMCQDKIDEKNDQIAMLRQQVQMQNLATSQSAQTAAILADNFAQTNALEQYLAPVPRPAYIVQNPNCCQQGFNCGCAA